MVWTMAPNRARRATRLRLAILVAVALLLAHTAVYAAEDGLGAAFAEAMSAGGHDGWWMPASAAIAAVGAIALLLAALRLAGLERRARRSRQRRGEPSVAPEALAIARRLVPAVVVLFAIQENVEQLVAHGRFPGIEVIVGPGHALTVPVLVLVALALSVAGGLVRWRIGALHRRLANGPAPVRRRIAADHAASPWRTVGALAPRHWMLDRLDAGRSPPLALPC